MRTSAHSSWSPPLVVLTALLGLLATNAWASVIYEFRSTGSSVVIGSMEIGSPATASGGWSADASDIVGLFLDDDVFGLGSANLLEAAAASSGGAGSLAGPGLDSGGLTLEFALPPPPIVGGPIERVLTTSFREAPGTDVILRGILERDGDDLGLDIDLALSGDWTAARVPEPGTLVLFGLGLIAAVRTMRRKAR